MSEKSILSEFKWALKKQAFSSYMLGTPTVEGFDEADYADARNRAGVYRSQAMGSLSDYMNAYGPGRPRSAYLDRKEFLKGLRERQEAVRNAARAEPMAETDLLRYRAAKQGLRPNIFGRLARSAGAAFGRILPAVPIVGRIT